MGLRKIGSLWKPKPGGTSVASGYIEHLGQQIRVVITFSKYASQKPGNNDFNIMADDGKDDRPQGQAASGGGFGGGGNPNYQTPAQSPPEGFSGAPASGPPAAAPPPAGPSAGQAPEPWE